MSILKEINFEGGIKYGLVLGKDKFILTEDDLVHSIRNNDEKVKLVVGWKNWTPECKEFTLSELKLLADEVEFTSFVHYWGIKDRVCSNYCLFQQSVKEIGISEILPKWGAR